MEFDPVIMEGPKNELPRASIEHLTIDSGGDRMLGVMFRPAGEGPHPVAVILHGFPGHDRNLDIAHMLRRGGFASVVFHYRGAWGSGGSFTFSNMLEDVRRVLDHLERNADQYSLDIGNLNIIGHSMGGWAAMMVASEDDRVRGVAGISGFNLGLAGSFIGDDIKARKLVENKFRELSKPFKVKSVELLLEEMIEGSDGLDLISRCSELVRRRILMIYSMNDELSVPRLHHGPLFMGLKEAGAEDLTGYCIDTDHSYSDSRLELQGAIWEWISEKPLEERRFLRD